MKCDCLLVDWAKLVKNAGTTTANACFLLLQTAKKVTVPGVVPSTVTMMNRIIFRLLSQEITLQHLGSQAACR